MNISPHHQRPTRYPWPGRASAAIVVVGVVLIVFIAYMLIRGTSTPEDQAPDPTGMRVTAAQRL